MEKSKLEKFIAKYNLGGSCESVLWKSDGTDITVKCISDDKNVLGVVTVKDAKLDEGEYGIFDTKQLSSMLSVLGEGIKITTKKNSGKVSAIHLTDDNAKVDYVLADSAVIPAAPDLKQLPSFDIEIKLDQKVMNTFLKAKGALSDVETFTILSDGSAAQIVLGYSLVLTFFAIWFLFAFAHLGDTGNFFPIFVGGFGAYGANFLREWYYGKFHDAPWDNTDLNMGSYGGIIGAILYLLLLA